MKIDIIFLIVLSIIIAYTFLINKVEKMTNDTPSTTDQIKEAVKQHYLADVESIRNLSEVATKLQTDGLTVPAHMNIKGKLNIGSDSNAKDFPDWLGLSVDNTTADATIRLKTKADDTKNVLLINRDGHFTINNKNGDLFGVNQTGRTYNISTGDNVYDFIGRGNNPYITISKEGEYDKKAWYMQNYKIDETSKLFRFGVHGEGAKLDIYQNGNVNFTGDIYTPGNIIASKNVNVNGLVIEKRNRARYIKVGNLDSTIAKDYWAPIELRAYDNSGNNVVQGKPVTVLQGSALNNTPPGNITDGRIFNSPKELHDNWHLGYLGNAGTNVLQIDLGAEIDLAQIVLFNRWSENDDWRMDGTTIELFGADNNRNRIIHTGLWHRQYSKEYLL
jgi:hypothetical protein